MSERTASCAHSSRPSFVGLGDRSADPGPGHCALERKGGILELLVKHFALVVYAMIDDNRQEETEASIGRVDAHDVESIEEKLAVEWLANFMEYRILSAAST